MSNRLWVNDNGSVICDKHAGTYLRSAIVANPKRTNYWTPLGTWEVMNNCPLPCETCVDWMTLELKAM